MRFCGLSVAFVDASLCGQSVVKELMIGKWTLVVVALVALTRSGVSAQAGSVGIGAGAGGAFPVERLNDFFEPGPGYNVFLTAGILENVALELQFAQSILIDRDPEPGFIFNDYDNLTVTTATVGPRVFFLDPTRVFRPWIAGGIGYTHLDAEGSADSPAPEEGGLPIVDSGGADESSSPQNPVPDDDRFGFDFAGGFDLGRPNWAFRFEARYFRNIGSSGGEDLAYVMPLVSFTYRFFTQPTS